MAPIGVHGILHADGELATARAAREVGLPFTMSTASSRSIERVAEANGNGQRWYQLYWPKHEDITISILNRAKASGFTALVVTLDTMVLGWRPHDLATAYLPFWHGLGCQVGSSDPVFMQRIGQKVRPDETPAWPHKAAELEKKFAAGDEEVVAASKMGREFLLETTASGIFRSWEDLKFLQQHWDGPIILKGIQSVAVSAEQTLTCRYTERAWNRTLRWP